MHIDAMFRLTNGPRLTRRRLMRAGLASGGAIAFAGLPTAPTSMRRVLAEEQPKTGGALTLNYNHSEFGTWDPLVGGMDGRNQIAGLIYDGLVRIGDDGVSLVPALAETWETSADGLTFTFTLREASFHDGSPVAADDVVYSLDRVRTESGTYLNNVLPPATIEAPDARTVIVRLERLWAPFLSALLTGEAVVLPRTLVEEQKALFFRHPIGTGPFKLESWEQEGPFNFGRNAAYWDQGKPHVERVSVVIVRPPDELAPLFLEGTLDIANAIPGEELDAFRAMDEVVLYETSEPAMWYGALNVARPPFADKLLRQAVNYATDKQAIIDAVFHGAGEPQNTYIPKVLGHDDSAPGYPFDLDRARAIVAQSSGKDGFDVEMLTFPGVDQVRAIAELLAEQWAAIGARVTVVDVAEFDARNRSGKFDVTFNGAGGGAGDPDKDATIARSDIMPMITGVPYKNERVDDLLGVAASTTDWPTREKAYKEVQAIVAEDAPFLFLFYPHSISAATTRIKGFAEHGPRLIDLWRDDA